MRGTVIREKDPNLNQLNTDEQLSSKVRPWMVTYQAALTYPVLVQKMLEPDQSVSNVEWGNS